MKYRFIHDHGYLTSAKHLCDLLQVSRSAYYRWCQMKPTIREQQNQALLERIADIHRESNKTYGSPRVWLALHQEGYRYNHKRIARLMHVHGIRPKTVRRFKVTTRSRSTQLVAPDLVQRQFNAPKPNRVWTSDITYIWTREGWAYLAVVLDLCSRMIVGWEVGSQLTASLVTSAVKRALYRRKPAEELILHSDRGSQYASNELRSLAKEQMIRLSMGVTGSCYDNAVTESFFHTLKTEHIYFHTYNTRQDVRTSVFEYIETFYNQRRLHSSLGGLSPLQFELKLT